MLITALSPVNWDRTAAAPLGEAPRGGLANWSTTAASPRLGTFPGVRLLPPLSLFTSFHFFLPFLFFSFNKYFEHLLFSDSATIYCVPRATRGGRFWRQGSGPGRCALILSNLGQTCGCRVSASGGVSTLARSPNPLPRKMPFYPRFTDEETEATELESAA